MARNSSKRQVDERIASALAPLGFKASRRDRLVKVVDKHSEIYLFPGVSSRRGRIIIEPTIGLDFLPLREALEKIEPLPTTQICHCFLGLLDKKEAWVSLELIGETIRTDGLDRITEVTRIALAELMPLCSARKIRELFMAWIHHPHAVAGEFVVLQEHLKLAVLERLMSEMQAGGLDASNPRDRIGS